MEQLKLDLLRLLRDDLNVIGIQSEIIEGTVCFSRKRIDKSSGMPVNMVSAVAGFSTSNIFYKIYCVENHNPQNNEVTSYSVKLNQNNFTLGAWEFTMARGSHFHNFINGIKQKLHLPFSKDPKDISKDLIKKIQQKVLSDGS